MYATLYPSNPMHYRIHNQSQNIIYIPNNTSSIPNESKMKIYGNIEGQLPQR